MPINMSPKFKQAFSGYEKNYTIIGGTATSIVLGAVAIESRTTKDYDMVIIEQDKDSEFYDVLVQFIEEGEYDPPIHEKGSPLFRFETKKEGYPSIIELFSPKPDWFVGESRVTPVSFDPSMSLSAMLLDSDYYDLLLTGREVIDELSVLSNTHLIVFKAKAWLDMTSRKENGEKVDSRNIKKHMSDITRLASSLERGASIQLPQSIKLDMDHFLDVLEKNTELIPENKDFVLTRYETLTALQELLK